MILYLHGFRSAPASIKATRLREHMAERGLAEHFWCGQLPIAPQAAIDLIEAQIARCGTPPTLVGSSLGGYYATWLAEKHDLRAIMVNPGVLSYISLAPYVGRQSNLYTGEVFDFTEQHIAELKALEVAQITRPERYWLMVETGDEILDYRHAVAKYAGARQTVLDGGDHGFSRWGDYLDEILAFAELA
ncbi:YqiA/YcfP family alpha/beta fold hydrolase [Denitromonas iodatirespirans]|uniref:Esterase n=1 Tax=Denitromonas iodatirespirans TaxID=2795389 RepID=A0A944D883_DENI1|nr:YqiA/YcfP family alpha/beta fold hydrolase [Denitromonas iodatirespirans]MBT0959717.1 esterase [Denitromonas iodatirespirans]